MQDAGTPPNVKGRGLDGRVCEGHCQMRTMRLPRFGSLGDGVLSLGLSPPMTLALRKPLSESVSRSVWTGQCPPLGSLQLLGICRAAGYVLLVSSNFPLTSGKRGALPKPTIFARCPRSSARPVSEPPHPPSTWAWGVGNFHLGARRFLRTYIPFFVVSPPLFFHSF